MACNSIKRGPNFSQHEIEKLVQLVRLHWDIVNNKDTDAATNASKIDAWKAIERAFNQDERCNIYRAHYVLRTKFDNLKRLRKKNSTQKVPKLEENSSPPDAEDDSFENFKSSSTVTKVKSCGYENFDLNDSSSETVEYSEPASGLSRNNVTAFVREPEKKYFIKEIDHFEDLAGVENEAEFELHQVSIDDPLLEAQDSCITQSTEGSLSRKRKCDESATISKGSYVTEFNDIRKRAFLEKHSITLRLLKEEAEQRRNTNLILQELREEEIRLRIQFMKEKHETELNLMKANLTQDEKT